MTKLSKAIGTFADVWEDDENKPPVGRHSYFWFAMYPTTIRAAILRLFIPLPQGMWGVATTSYCIPYAARNTSGRKPLYSRTRLDLSDGRKSFESMEPSIPVDI